MKTKICQPINTETIDEIQKIIEQHDLICNTLYDLEESFVITSGILTIQEYRTRAEARLRELESKLNLYGYTFEDEPKEVKYAVNELKG